MVIYNWDARTSKIAIAGIFMALFLGFLNIESLKESSLDYLILNTYGNLNINEIKYVVPVLIWLLSQVTLMYLTGNIIPQQLSRHAIYIFTRTKERQKWILYSILQLLLYTILFFTVQFVTFGALFSFFSINLKFSIIPILIELLLIILYHFMILLIMNFVSLFLTPTMSFSLVTLFIMITIFAVGGSYLFNSNLLVITKYLPTLQPLFLWHDSVLVLPYKNISSLYIVEGMSISFSFSYMSICCCAVILLMKAKIEKMDIL